MRLSPFPPDADRPWRGVWVYASHAVEQHLRSPAFWLMVLGMIALVAVSALAPRGRSQSGSSLRLQVVVADAGLMEQVRATDGLQRYELRAEPDPESEVWLELGGTSVATLAPRLVVATGTGDRERERAERLVRKLRRERALPPEALPAEVESGPSGGVGEWASAAAPMAVALMALLGVMSGSGASMQAARSRDEEYYAVLRLGTPTAVLFFGTLAEQALMALLWMFPVAVLALLVLGLSTLLQGFNGGERALIGIVAVPLLGLSAVSAAFGVGAGAGSVAGSLVRSRWALAGGGQMMQFALIGVGVLGLGAFMEPVSSVVWQLAIPAVGAAVAAKGLADGLGLGWVAATVVLQLAWALVGLRVGTWAHGLDEGLLAEVGWRLRRAWRRT